MVGLKLTEANRAAIKHWEDVMGDEFRLDFDAEDFHYLWCENEEWQRDILADKLLAASNRIVG